MNKVVLSGYFGFDNAGDEQILFSMVQTLRSLDPGLEIIVLSQQPEKTSRQYGVRAVNRWRLKEIMGALRRCDLFISGGGSLLQDVSSPNSPLYYLGLMLLAKIMSKQVMIYAQGAGPLTKRRNRLLTAWILNRADLITVREEGSKKELQALGVAGEITVTADPVFGLEEKDTETGRGAEILAAAGLARAGGSRLLGVCVRSWQENSFLPALAKACDRLVLAGWQVVFIPLHYPQDVETAEQVRQQMDQPSLVLRELYAPSEILSLILNMDLVLGMRLHALIDSAVLGVPLVGISYDPKIDRFLEQIGRQSLIPVRDMQPGPVFELVEWVYEQCREINTDTDQRLVLLRKEAWRTARMALGLMLRGDNK